MEKSRQLADCDARLQTSQARVMKLTEVNARLEVIAKQPKTPTLTRIATLEGKIVRMEERYKIRVNDLRTVADDVASRSRQELLSIQRKHDVEIASKNSVIQRFRMELDSLLNAVQHAKRVKVRSKESSP